MNYGICGCTIGPPPYPERCTACGASGPAPYAQPYFPPLPAPLTADDIRRIVREELARAKEAK